MRLAAFFGIVYPRAEVKRLRTELSEFVEMKRLLEERILLMQPRIEALERNLVESKQTAIHCLQAQVDWYARRAGGPTVYGEDLHPDDPQRAAYEQRVSHKLPGRIAVREANRRWLEEIRKQIQLKADQQEAQQEAPANADGD